MKEEGQVWLEINDPEITAVELQAMVEQRLSLRQEEGGYTAVHFPEFGARRAMPVLTDSRLSPDLFFHLGVLNQLELPESLPVLAASPATRIPILGSLWKMLRHHAHELVCFYVNRLADHTVMTQQEMISVLNELTRLSQAQQAEIEQLRLEVQALKEGNH